MRKKALKTTRQPGKWLPVITVALDMMRYWKLLCKRLLHHVVSKKRVHQLSKELKVSFPPQTLRPRRKEKPQRV